MKRLKIFSMTAVFFAVLAVIAQGATCWRIINGPGAGVVLFGNGTFISDPDFGAEGHIANPDKCSCLHYHGTLFDEPDSNPSKCGWGCVEQVPCDATEALSDLLAAIDSIPGTNSDLIALKAKLNSILECVTFAAGNDCNTLFIGALNAFSQEILGAFLDGLISVDVLDQFAKVIPEYAALALDEMDLEPPPPPPVCCKVNLLLRLGSGKNAELVDAGRKYTAHRSEVVTLEASGCPGNGPFLWEYQFKGSPMGEVPSGTGVGFKKNGINLLSERAGSVKVTVIFVCPDGKEVKDSITITFQ